MPQINHLQILLGKKWFKQRIREFSKLNDDLSALLKTDSYPPDIEEYQKRIETTRKIIFTDIFRSLEIYRVSHSISISERIEFPDSFPEKLMFIKQVRFLKSQLVITNQFEKAARVRNRERELYTKLQLEPYYLQLNSVVRKAIHSHTNIFDYYSIMMALTERIHAAYHIEFEDTVAHLKKLCIYCCLEEIYYKMRKSDKRDFKHAMTSFDKAKSKLEMKLIFRI